jgi:hypothetical protein
MSFSCVHGLPPDFDWRCEPTMILWLALVGAREADDTAGRVGGLSRSRAQAAAPARRRARNASACRT